MQGGKDNPWETTGEHKHDLEFVRAGHVERPGKEDRKYANGDFGGDIKRSDNLPTCHLVLCYNAISRCVRVSISLEGYLTR